MQHRGPDLIEDKRVEFVGSHVALRASPILPSSPERIVIAAMIGPESLVPLAGDLAWHAELCRDAVVAKSLARQEHDLRPHHIALRRRTFLAAGRQFGSPLAMSSRVHENTSPNL